MEQAQQVHALEQPLRVHAIAGTKTPSTLRAAACALVLAPVCALCLLPQLVRADQIIVHDVSLSSPTMHPATGAAFAAHVAQQVAPRIGQLELGSRLVVFNVGSHQERGAPVFDKLVQRVRTQSGDTAAAYEKAFPAFFAGVTEARRRQQQGTQSHLTAGIASARKLVRKGQRCDIVLLSDGAEWDQHGLQYPRDWQRPLPKVPDLDLKGCSVHVMGAGQGMPPKQAAAIERHWLKWLKEAGAESVRLERF